MEFFKAFVNNATRPQVLFPCLLVFTVLMFPPNEILFKINKKLRLYKLWTRAGGFIFFSAMIAFFVFGLSDPNFRKIVTKPDNVPIVGLLFLVNFFLWFSMKQAHENDARMEEGKEPREAIEAKEKVLVWPDLVFVEFISLILCTVLLLGWSILLKAPLEEPANPAVSPNPSKAPWYFLGLQEMLVYFDPWLAGVVFPTMIILGLMAIPYLDDNKKGRGYYSFKERKTAVSIFVTLWLLFWIFLITVGTFLRGPNWNFFGPFEVWDVNKLEALTNVNVSEYFYMIWLKRALPHQILFREFPGLLLLLFYFGVLPPLLAKTLFKNIYKSLGAFRYSVFIMLLLTAASLPMKMFLRWVFNIKYIVAIPEFFFNI